MIDKDGQIFFRNKAKPSYTLNWPNDSDGNYDSYEHGFAVTMKQVKGKDDQINILFLFKNDLYHRAYFGS